VIPQLLIGVGFAAITLEVVSGAAAAGAGYGLGRKYGRKLCIAMDSIEKNVSETLGKLRK
jgi:hypothetical protein